LKGVKEMEVASVVADILRQEGVEFLTGFPENPFIDAAAQIGIRPIIVRQERTAVHMADGFSRVSAGKRIGVCVTQYGPGAENAFGGIAQAYSESVPLVVLPTGYPRSLAGLPPNFSALVNYRHITKWLEQVTLPREVPSALRRAFTQVRSGRPRPVVVEFPTDLIHEKLADGFEYSPTFSVRTAPDPLAVREVAKVLLIRTD
jgi:acetolactate synthase-1/2/3 large subunit